MLTINSQSTLVALMLKKNPVGWLCAITRQDYAFVKYMAMLEEQNKDLIPYYLIVIMDDETYINVHGDLEQYLMVGRISKNQTDGYVPSSVETPVIFAGYRNGLNLWIEPSRHTWKRSQTCIHNTTICHNVKDPNDMKRLYTESESNRTNSF